MIIGAGRLDKKIKLYEPTTEVTGGVHTTEYKLKYTVWANLKQVTLREIIKSNVELQSETYTVYIRYKAGITNRWRVELPNGKYYRVNTINVDSVAGSIILGIELDNSITQEIAT